MGLVLYMLHYQAIRGVWVQSSLFCFVLFSVHWKRCHTFREHGAMALEKAEW